MPLSTPTEREPVHTRTLELNAYRRADGLYDVEGHLVDTKPFTYQMHDATWPAGQPFHDMWLRLTVDRTGAVHDAEATMDVGPHTTCHLVTPSFRRLIGLELGRGWRREVRARLGGIEGCTHLTEMLSQLATTALQAIWADVEAEQRAAGRMPALDPGVLNSCYTYREDGEHVREYFPAHHRPGGQSTP